MTREDLDNYLRLREQFEREAHELLQMHCKIKGWGICFEYDDITVENETLRFIPYNWCNTENIPLAYLLEPTMRQQMEEEAAELDARAEAKRKRIRDARKKSKEDKDRQKLAELIGKYGIPDLDKD
jgi:hypothetical protein